ncbi:MAG: hypothetical protein HWD58_04755 [Bacteroidota bacterium]|nr:MAG: hypothetical protein HWD58_04755 [Bacteroidota bacterium]
MTIIYLPISPTGGVSFVQRSFPASPTLGTSFEGWSWNSSDNSGFNFDNSTGLGGFSWDLHQIFVSN